MEPQANHRICDPMCGSGGFLIHSRKFVKKHLKKGQNIRDMTLHGQESNPDTVSMCKMNMVLHEIPNARIEDGDVVTAKDENNDGDPIQLVAVCTGEGTELVSCTWIPLEESKRTEAEQALAEKAGKR